MGSVLSRMYKINNNYVRLWAK